MIELKKKYMKLSNGEELAYLETGTGDETIVFVHGNMSSSIHYEPLLRRLPDNFTAFTPDLRGFGDSTYHTRVNGLEDFADDLHDFISRLGLKDFTMVGWSTGGGICMSYQIQYPGFAKKIALIESVSPFGYPIYKKDEQGAPVIGSFYETREELSLDPVQVLPAAKAMKEKNFEYMNYLWDVAIYTVNKPEPEMNHLFINESLKQRNLADVNWSLATFNLTNNHNGYVQGTGSISRISLPIMVFWSEKDCVVLENMALETVEALRGNAIYQLLKDSGHSPLIDCPEYLASQLWTFAMED